MTTELYFRMVMPWRAEWLTQPELTRMLDGPAWDAETVALAYADDADWRHHLASRGFSQRGSLRGEISGRGIDLLWLPPGRRPTGP